MDYFDPELLQEDLIGDLGLRNPPKSLFKSLGNLAKSLFDFGKLTELTDEAKYEEFLSNGFTEIINKYGRDSSLLVTYSSKKKSLRDTLKGVGLTKSESGNLYTISGISGSSLGLTGFSSEISGKKIKLALAKINVVRASPGSTGYKNTNYNKLKNAEGETVTFIQGKVNKQVVIQDVTQNRVILIDEQEKRATLNHDTFYISSKDGIKIIRANIIYNISAYEAKENDGKYFIEKTLFDLEKRDVSPTLPFFSANEKTKNKIIQSLRKLGKESPVELYSMEEDQINEYEALEYPDSFLDSIYTPSDNSLRIFGLVTSIDNEKITFKYLNEPDKSLELQLDDFHGVLTGKSDKSATNLIKNLKPEALDKEGKVSFPVLFFGQSEYSAVRDKASDEYAKSSKKSQEENKDNSSIVKALEDWFNNLKKEDHPSKEFTQSIPQLSIDIANPKVTYRIKVGKKFIKDEKAKFSIAKFEKGNLYFISEDEEKKEVSVEAMRLFKIVKGKDSTMLTFTEDEAKDPSEEDKDPPNNDEGGNKDSGNDPPDNSGEESKDPNKPMEESYSEDYLIKFFE